MKTLIAILLLIFMNVYADDDFTYDNGVTVVYEETNGNTHQVSITNPHMFKIPGTDCVVSRETHTYDRKLKDDTFIRKVACFNPDSETIFRCSYDPNWKDSDGEPDETTTVCSQKVGKTTVYMGIKRYPNGKYKYKEMWKRNIESKKAI